MKIFLRVALFCSIITLVEYAFGWGVVFEEMKMLALESGSAELFFLGMGIGCALGLPVSLCYFSAGAAFGILEGWGLCLMALVLSSTMGFFAGRFILPCGWAESRLKRSALSGVMAKMGVGNVVGKIGTARADFDICFFIRAVPGVPYWLQNIFLGALSVRFGVYFFVGLFVQGAIALAVICIGAAAADSSWVGIPVFALLVAVLAIFRHFGLVFADRLSLEKGARL